MNKARIAVLGVALTAGAAAWWLMSGAAPPPPSSPQIVAAAPAVETTGVLIASREIPMGTQIGEGDMRWQQWPRGDLPDYIIRQEGDSAKVIEELKGSIARVAFAVGEPMRRDKLIKGMGAGYLSAILPQGYRAVAINIDSTGSTTAGGFILPNDRVDVVRVFRDDVESKARGADVYASETILSNVRVLAIGQNVQEKNGATTGSTNATLELDPRQVEQIVMAQRVGGGNLTLALRSMLDAAKREGGPPEDVGRGLTIVRFGQQSQSR
ncbi:MAG: Flp pilus assembly protein CpaB [Methylobacteriaceae bacterium]|nr:Flp pilus assembly protein CpaB [Methylobacteriaceae bacterium]